MLSLKLDKISMIMESMIMKVDMIMNQNINKNILNY